MTLFYLLRYYPTLTETFIYTEISELLKQGTTITILALGSRKDGELQRNLPNCPIHYAPKNRLKRLLPAQTKGEKWLLQQQRQKDIVRLAWLKKMVKQSDHIHVHFAGEAAELACALHMDSKIPYSVTTHAVDIFKPRMA